MPDDLEAAVTRYPDDIRQLIMSNWEAIGDEGRELLQRYIDKSRRRRERRTRCELAAEQLISPDTTWRPWGYVSGLP